MRAPTIADVIAESGGNPIALVGLGFYVWVLQRRRLELLAVLRARAAVEPDGVFPPRPPGLERRPPLEETDPILRSEPQHWRRRS